MGKLNPRGNVYKYAEQTGGEVVKAGNGDIVLKLAALIDHLGTRYSLGYVSSNSRQNGKFRKIQVKVSRLDSDLLREARILAAEEDPSISAPLTERVEAMVRERKSFDKARRRAFARLRTGLNLRWAPPKSRGELHER